jgi:hypothetical protein
MKTPGTLAFLLRWHSVPFIAGTVLASVAGYQLWTHTPAAPSSLDSAINSAADIFEPVMWLLLLAGLAVAGRAFLKARSMAR